MLNNFISLTNISLGEGYLKSFTCIFYGYLLDAGIHLSNFQVQIQIQNTPLFFSRYPQVRYLSFSLYRRTLLVWWTLELSEIFQTFNSELLYKIVGPTGLCVKWLIQFILHLFSTTAYVWLVFLCLLRKHSHNFWFLIFDSSVLLFWKALPLV